jgi:uncharacterized protein with von Willebrand factor type A (vWA) domain
MNDGMAVFPRVSDAAGPAGTVPLLAGRIVEFVRLARANHFRAGVQESIDALEVARRVEMHDQRQLRWGLRTLLCSNAADWARFDVFFDRYWQRPNRRRMQLSVEGFLDQSAPAGVPNSAGREPLPRARGEEDAAESLLRVGASRQESMTRSDFRLSQLNADTRELEQWIEQVARRMRKRLLRRHQIRSTGNRLHMRRTIRRSLRYGGQPLELILQQRRRELPRLVLITDVSRSMNVYSYFFLRFARGIIDAFKDTEAFAFHTRLVHLTDTLKERDSHRLKDKLAWISAGWGGGTCIGECLQTFNREFARRMVGSGTYVFIMSDGYDTGAPELLAEQVYQIKRRAKRVIWLNPLLGREDYSPTAEGIRAVLPHLDLFAPAHSLESLMKIEDMLVNL